MEFSKFGMMNLVRISLTSLKQMWPRKKSTGL
jgi:hypothetical protein